MTSKAYAPRQDSLDWDVGVGDDPALARSAIDADLDSFSEADFGDDSLGVLQDPTGTPRVIADPYSSEERYAPVVAPDRGAEHPVPRISIAAFCDRPEIASLLGSIAADRRLSKATITVELGGVTAGIARLSAQASPNLLILDLGGPPAALLANLERIAKYVDAGSKALVIGAANDIGLYRELMRRGVSEYLVPPLQPVDVIRAISALYADPDKPFVGRVAAILGARGGVGSSSIAQNVSWALAERFHVATTLIDLDVSFGTTGLAFDEDANMGVGEALQKADQLDQTYLERLLVRRSEHLSLFPTSAALERDLEASPGAYEILIDQARRLSPFVVLDLPHAWSRWMRSTVLSADEVIIVASPDLASLRNAKNLFDVIRTNRPHDWPPALVLNMVGVPKRPEIPVKDFCKAVSADPVSIIPFDPETFGVAANAGQMVLAAAPASRPAIAIDSIARALCGREPAPARKVSVLNRILKR
jgi:pilus assembly protein CpaE